MAKETMLRGILTHSEVLDYITREDVEKKIEALIEKDRERRKQTPLDFKEVTDSSLPDEEKESMMKAIINEHISGQAAIEKEQREAALRVRRDYVQFKKHENEAYSAIVKGNLMKYDRSLRKAAEAAENVDMGLEYIEVAGDFLKGFKVTKIKITSEEEADELNGAE